MESPRALPKITEVFPYWQDINSTDRLAMARQAQYHALPRGKIFCINDAITVSSLYVISGEVRYLYHQWRWTRHNALPTAQGPIHKLP